MIHNSQTVVTLLDDCEQSSSNNADWILLLRKHIEENQLNFGKKILIKSGLMKLYYRPLLCNHPVSGTRRMTIFVKKIEDFSNCPYT